MEGSDLTTHRDANGTGGRGGIASLWVVSGLVVLFLTGCKTAQDCSITYRLWSSSDFHRYREPAPNPNLALSRAADTGDVIVQYDALTGKNDVLELLGDFRQNRQAAVRF